MMYVLTTESVCMCMSVCVCVYDVHGRGNALSLNIDYLSAESVVNSLYLLELVNLCTIKV